MILQWFQTCWLEALARKNRTSAPRRGFYYQDLCALRIVASWLADPGRYEWIQFEVSPSEDESQSASLDDIVLADSNALHLQQVKHVQNSNTSWTWADLLKRKKAKDGRQLPSLLQRWYQSFHKIREGQAIESACFVTDGSADSEILKVLSNNRIDPEALKKHNSSVYNQLCEQLEDSHKRELFFRIFEFQFRKETPELVFELLRKEFLETLRVTDAGFQKVLHKIQEEARKPITTKLEITQIRNWCEFDEPRALDQTFHIPHDFQLFDQQQHTDFLNELKNPAGGIKVVSGKPGSGKSTYLSRLADLLSADEIPCIRHHYHIEIGHREEHERLFHERAIEGLKSQLKQYREELGELAHKNSAGVSVHEYLETLASTCRASGMPVVLIIDGLDNALRSASADELTKLLTAVCRPQAGLWLIFGMQESAQTFLPPIVESVCPKNTWLQIHGLSHQKLESILAANFIQLNLSNSRRDVKEIASKLFQITGGNPLHLRYSLRELKKNTGDRPVTAQDCDNLRPYDGDIATYYRSLWRAVPQTAKTIILSLVNTGFPLSKKQLVEFLSTFKDPTDISIGLSSIEHLTESQRSGIRIYHDSLRVFTKEQLEYEEQKQALSRKMLDWLNESKYTDLIWCESRKLSWILGDSQPITSLDRNWLIEAICYPREPDRILQQLSLGAEAAFVDGNFEKCLELSHYHLLYSNAITSDDYAVGKIWKEALRYSDIKSLAGWNLSTLSSEAIKELAWKLYDVSSDPSAEVDDCIDELDRRHATFDSYERGGFYTRVPPLPADLVSIASLDPGISYQKVFRYIRTFRDDGWEPELSKVFVEGLLARRQYVRLNQFCTQALTRAALSSIELSRVEYDFRNNSKRFVQNLDETATDHALLSVVFASISLRKAFIVPQLPEGDQIPQTLEDYRSTEIDKFQELLVQLFLSGILFGIADRRTEVGSWYESMRESPTQLTSAKFLEAGFLIGRAVAEGSPIDVALPVRLIETIPEISLEDSRSHYGARQALKGAIRIVIKFTVYIRRNLSDTSGEDKEFVNLFFSSRHVNIYDILQILIHAEVPILAFDAYQYFIDRALQYICFLKEGFSQRADWYADLSRVAAMYEDHQTHRQLLQLAASNFIAFGMRDNLVDEILESMKFLKEAGVDITQQAVDITSTVLTLVDHCEEVSHLPSKLAETLRVSGSIELLSAFYFESCTAENYTLAETTLHELIKALSLTEEFEIRFVGTAIDKDSIDTLQMRAEDNEGARMALDDIRSFTRDNDDRHQRTQYRNEEKELAPEFDPSTIHPKKLLSFLHSIETWDRRKYLQPWVNHWTTEENNRANEAYFLVKDLLTEDHTSIDGDVLDAIYEASWQFEPENTFDIVCQAQAYNYGWSFRESEKPPRERRWKFVCEKFKPRTLEFFKRSILHAVKRRQGTNPPFIPVALGIQFLTQAQHIDIASRIVDKAISLAEELLADAPRAKRSWKKGLTPLDLLVHRLAWPSQLVRERTAVSLARLLDSRNFRKQTFDCMKVWITNQPLESLAIGALIPLFRVSPDTFREIDVAGLINAVPTKSILLKEIATELSAQFGTSIAMEEDAPPRIPDATDEYKLSRVFKRRLSQLISPALVETSELLGEHFRRNWSYLADQIMKELSIHVRIDLLQEYGLRRGMIFGLSYKASEVYKTAFLRLLQDYHSRELITKQDLRRFSLFLFPIDLSLWTIKPGKKPSWWPMPIPTEKEIDKQFCKDVSEELISKVSSSSDEIIGACCGSIDVGHLDSRESTIYLRAALFAFKGDIKHLSTDAKDIERVIYSGNTILDLTDCSRPLNFFESTSNHRPAGGRFFKTDHGSVFPLTSRLSGVEINTWQWYRKYSSIDQFVQFGPNLHFFGDYSIRANQTSWSYIQDGEVLARAGDWTSNITERVSNRSLLGCGSFINFSTDQLVEQLEYQGATLAVALHFTQKIPGSTYSERDVRHKEFYLVAILPD